MTFVRHRFTVDQYERMVEAGVLDEDDRVELIAGEVVEKVPLSAEHSFCVNTLAGVFQRELADRAFVKVQDAVRLTPDSEPEPDIVLARPPATRYRHAHPGPGDVLLLVEVAHSAILRDRAGKLPVYAGHGIGEVWLVDVPAERIEVYREPRDDGYASITLVERSGTISPLAFPELVVRVDDILP